MWVRSTQAQSIRDRRAQTPRGREKGRDKCPRTQRHPRLSTENPKSSSFLMNFNQGISGSEPGTLRIQVCTRCIISVGFCSLQQFVSNEIIFADVATYCRDIIQRQSQACKCTHIQEGDPSLDCVHPTKAKIQLMKGRG